MTTTPAIEDLKAEFTLCCQNAMAAYDQAKTLPRSRDIQSYWNLRARACRELLSTDDYMNLEDEVGWDTRGGQNGCRIRQF